MLKQEEIEVLTLLTKAVCKFTQLEVIHPNESQEFYQGVHALQNMIMSRSAVRHHPEIFHRIPEFNEQERIKNMLDIARSPSLGNVIEEWIKAEPK